MKRICLLTALALAAPGCGDGSGGKGGENVDAAVARPDASTATWPSGRSGFSYDNAAGERVDSTVFVPEGEGPFPVVLVLHGSGGLFDEPVDPDNPPSDPGTAEMENQFEDWGGIINDEGWVAFFPGSFFSRGFFDWNKDPHPDLSVEDRLVFRTLDAWAALALLCTRDEIDCTRMAMLGFSNGGSAIIMSLYEDVDQVAGLEILQGTERPLPLTSVAYYPGCGLQGFVSLGSPDAYYPAAPIHVQHAEFDPLLDNCNVRLAQSDVVTAARALPSNLFEQRVYLGADHGFDSSPDNTVEETAMADARARALSILRTALSP